MKIIINVASNITIFSILFQLVINLIMILQSLLLLSTFPFWLLKTPINVRASFTTISQ